MYLFIYFFFRWAVHLMRVWRILATHLRFFMVSGRPVRITATGPVGHGPHQYALILPPIFLNWLYLSKGRRFISRTAIEKLSGVLNRVYVLRPEQQRLLHPLSTIYPFFLFSFVL